MVKAVSDALVNIGRVMIEIENVWCIVTEEDSLDLDICTQNFQTAITLAEENALLRKQIKNFSKENLRLNHW